MIKIQSYKGMLKKVNIQMNEFKDKISKGEEFCCIGCSKLIQSIEENLVLLLVSCKPDLSRKYLKKLTITSNRWASISKKYFQKIPDLCPKNEQINMTRFCSKIARCWANVATLAVGSYLDQPFATGAIVGALSLLLEVSGVTTLQKLGVISKSPASSEYGTQIKEMGPIQTGLIFPVIEEIIFRALLQETIGVIPTATLFGLVHLSNNHPENKIQAFLATLGGFIYGDLYDGLGITAPIAAHMMSNSICSLLDDFSKADLTPLARSNPSRTPEQMRKAVLAIHEEIKRILAV